MRAVVSVVLFAAAVSAAVSAPRPVLRLVEQSVLHELSLTVANGINDETNQRLGGLLCENVTDWTPAPPNAVVDLRIGSGGDGYGCANFNPGVQLPFGAMRIGPDTSIDWLRIPWRHGGGYSWCDTHVRGFSHTHMVAPGVDDLGNIGFMPYTGAGTGGLTKYDVTCFNPLQPISPGTDIRICNYRQPHHHTTETVSPSYYSTVLYPQPERPAKVNHTILAEFTASHKSAFHRYSWSCPAGDECDSNARRLLIVNVCHMVSYSSKNCVAGGVSIDPTTNTMTGTVHNDADYSRRFGGFDIFFVARFGVDSPLNGELSGTWSNGEFFPGVLSNANLTDDGGGFLDFGTVGSTDAPVTLRLGMSFISYEFAAANLEAEIPDSESFESVVSTAAGLWDQKIHGLVTINSGGSTDDALKFRTALYHSTMAPTNWTEFGGNYMGFDKVPHNTDNKFVFHTDMSIWDIMRTQFPFLVFFAPETAFNVMQSMITVADQTGLLPKWILANGETNGMEACHSVVMLMDGILGGIPGINETDVLLKMNSSLRARQGPEYLIRGYMTDSPCETQEYALDDWCTAQLASKLGTFPEIESSFTRTAGFWQNVWDQKSQFFCPYNATGGLEQCTGPLWPDEALFVFDKHYTEGDAWHWRWFAPHAMPSLVNKLGGADNFATLFNEFMYKSRDQVTNFLPNPWYWSGNEPDIQVPYLAHYVNRPDLVQEYVRWLMEVKYTTRPDGIPGNDDYGTMSAWFVWSAIGIYPISCQGVYATGSPLFGSVTVHRPAYGSLPPCDLTVNAYNNSATNIYVSKLVLNGAAVTSGFINIADLTNNGQPTSLLEFWMTDVPTKYY